MEGDFYKWRNVSPRLERFFLWQDQKTLQTVGQIFERIKTQSNYVEGPQILIDVRSALRSPGFSYEAAQVFLGMLSQKRGLIYQL